MVNKDFLKAVLNGKKKLMKLKEVKFVNPPFYDEISVTHLWPKMTKDPGFMQFMPSSLPKGKQCERAYFFNVFNTLHEDRL